LPEALVLTAGFDPLVDEGEAYALRLAQAGVRTTLRRFPGQVHGFVTRGKVIPEAQEAIDEATALLRARFFQKASAPIGAEGI
jgi:acetyl esterase